MKHWYLILLLGWLISCSSESSTVCDQIEPDQICMDYKTSNLGLQTWYKNGNYFIVHIANNQDGNPYIPQLDLYFRLFDHVADPVPQPGNYKAVSFINANLSSKQFDLDFYIDGEEDYTLDLAETSTFEIETISGWVLDGKAFCYLKHENGGTDRKQVNVNFQGAIYQ